MLKRYLHCSFLRTYLSACSIMFCLSQRDLHLHLYVTSHERQGNLITGFVVE